MAFLKKDKCKIFAFTLSTCAHCRNSKKLLKSLVPDFDFVDVDTLNEHDKAEALEEIGQYNPAQTFPTIIIGSKVIVGYKADDIRQACERLKDNP